MKKTASIQLTLLQQMHHNHLAQAISLVLAGMFSSGVFADTNVTTADTVGISTTGTHNGETIKLGATRTTGVEADVGEHIQFDAGRVESSAINAAQAKNQVGLHAKDGGHIAASDSLVILVPKTALGVVITASDMTGALVEAGGRLSLRETSVEIGGGAKGNNNLGVLVRGVKSTLDMHGGSVSTSSWGAPAITVREGASATLSEGASITTSGARSTTTGGSHGVVVSGTGSQLSGSDITVTTTGGSAYGVRVDDSAVVNLTNASVSTAGGNGHAVLADGTHSRIDMTGGSLSTTGKGSVGAWARNGAAINLSGTEVRTSGAAISSTAPVDGEKALSLSHGLLASGTGSAINAKDSSLQIGAGSASAARAEDGARINLSDSTVTVSGGATSTTTTAALHALNGAVIDGTGLSVTSNGVNVGGARADGTDSQVLLKDSTVTVRGAGSVANPAAAARAMNGARVTIDNSQLTAEGQYGHGISVEGAGSHAEVSRSSISVGGNRSIGVNIVGGASTKVAGSSISATAAPGAVGPFAPGVLVEGASSKLQLDDSDVGTSQGSSHGLQVGNGGDVTINNGSITTGGNYSTGISAGNATVSANNVTVTTHGNDNAMGVVANGNATIRLNGGSITTTGNGSPVQSNLTFPHALASRNPGALLISDGTSLLTKGSQAYGAAVDDGGSMILKNLSVKTEGQYSRGLYAGIGILKPGNVSLTADNLTVETLGDYATGALTSRQYNDETATLDLSNTSIRTHGLQSHGLQSESGAALTAKDTVVNTSGLGALGAMANNSATVDLDVVDISTSGDAGHGVVAKNGGSVTGSDVVVRTNGDQAAALYAQGTDALKGTVSLDRGVLNNRSGATIAVAGVADIDLQNSIVGGSGQWLNVDRSVASSGTSIPDMGTGQWQGVGQSLSSDGKATIDLGNSLVTGSARTATGSQADVAMHDTSIWQLTGESNLSRLSNDRSLIDFSTPVGGQFKNLTVNDYHGANGTIALNTYLFDDASPSDQLVIDGGSATGSSNLQIKNAGGAGALTTGNGIKVVDAINGGSTDTNAFRLLSRVVAGPYEYTLHRSSLDDSNGEAWYLRSTQDAVQPVGLVGLVDPANPVGLVDPVDPTNRTTPSEPVPQVPNYRPETSLYSGIPTQALLYSRAMVDTLHERVGEERRRATVDPLLGEDDSEFGPSLGWGRLIYRTGKDTRGSADYNYDLRAFQVGVDLYRSEDTDGSTNQAGLSLGLGKIDGAIKHTNGAYAGDDAMRGYSLGGYWTHFGPSGWYLDGVLQLHKFTATANPDSVDKVKTRGHGVTASLEVGKPFVFNEEKEIYIEPQAQVIVTKIKLQDTHDAAADVRFDDVDSLTGRLGVRIDRDWFRTDDKGEIHRTNGWVRPSVWHEFKGQPKTEFSSTDGYVPFAVDMSGTWGEVNLGVDYEYNARTTLTGSLGYQKAFDGDSRSYEGMLGIKVKF
ncbi:autotransporter outer membrane beta-barrel domain-containing protein [Pseudomonas sp. LS44]|uniref:autotransporter outer membrane beta-barrel domain-containing protein n=1 Tax=Pseudomonas sp. LS44 TaxID=1357074 RepID=UPI00215A15ED|nr:autotransporter outer membrane beta-barrel domain-containing protein [Pseudomonas sp. LS44]UVE19306.1 autotransporter outer membrane beta-barrel domain-containing protein [Pseudomonas sp. LS44]